MRNAIAVAMIGAISLAGCRHASTDGGPWVGTTETRGDTTLVTTVSGGTWNLAGPIRLDSAKILWDGGTLRSLAPMAVGDDGTIYAAEATQLDVIRPDGSVAPPIGRAGQGPGEFQEISGVYAGNDSLLVWDRGNRRLTLLDRTGRVIGTYPVIFPASLQGPQPIALFPAPAGIVMTWSHGMIAPDAPPDTFAVMLGTFGPDSTHWRTLVDLRDMQWAHMGGMVGPKHVFGERPVVAVGREGLFAVSQGADYWVNWGAATSTKVTRIVRQLDPVPVLGKIGEIPEAVLKHVPPTLQASFRGLASASLYGKVRNSIDELRIDDAGRLWVRIETPADTLNPMLSHWYPEGRAPRYHWDLYASGGQRLGAIELPSRFTPDAFRQGVVYGIYEEEDGNNAVAKVVLPEVAK